ncbi:MAG: hypothetical protein JKY95_09260 [Planctomycetaceae bacterium]|nr:hypothetical protein [Planctomycetaceae bacterium]
MSAEFSSKERSELIHELFHTEPAANAQPFLRSRKGARLLETALNSAYFKVITAILAY